MVFGEIYIVAAVIFAAAVTCLWIKTTRKVNEIKKEIEREREQ